MLSCQVLSLRKGSVLEHLDMAHGRFRAVSCLLKVLCRQSNLTTGSEQRQLAQLRQHQQRVVQRSLSMFMRSAISPRKP